MNSIAQEFIVYKLGWCFIKCKLYNPVYAGINSVAMEFIPICLVILNVYLYAGTDREGMAVVRSQVHGSLRIPGYSRQQGSVPSVHTVRGGHVAGHAAVSVRISVQRTLPPDNP